MIQHPEWVIGAFFGALQHEVPMLPAAPVYEEMGGITVAAFNEAFRLWQSNCNQEILMSALNSLAMNGFGAVTVVRLTPRIVQMMTHADRAITHVHNNLPNWITHAIGPGHAPAGFNAFHGPAHSLADDPSSSSSSGPLVLPHPPHGLNPVPLPAPDLAPGFASRIAASKANAVSGSWVRSGEHGVPTRAMAKTNMYSWPQHVPPPPKASARGSGKKKKIETIETKKALMPYFDIMDDPYFIKV